VQEGLLRRASRDGQNYSDQVLWSLLTDDWLGTRVAGTRVH